jgi:hypothetical protein
MSALPPESGHGSAQLEGSTVERPRGGNVQGCYRFTGSGTFASEKALQYVTVTR